MGRSEKEGRMVYIKGAGRKDKYKDAWKKEEGCSSVSSSSIPAIYLIPVIGVREDIIFLEASTAEKKGGGRSPNCVRYAAEKYIFSSPETKQK